MSEPDSRLGQFRGLRPVALLLLLALAGCGGERATPPRPRVVAFVSLDEMFARPILEDFERATGIEVALVTDPEAAKTAGLMNRLIEMRERPEADVFWNNEAMRSVVLKRRGVADRYVPATAADIPARYRDPDGAWVGFAARARVILYNTDLVKDAEAPRSVFAFLEPAWRGRFAVANPLFGTTSTHVAALYVALGAEKAEALLRGWKENGCRIVAGNAVARNLVAEGEVAACLTDTDDAAVAIAAGKPVRMVYPDQDGIGALVLPNSVLVVRGAPHPEAARRLADFIASRDVEARLAKARGAQIPLRAGVEPHGPAFDLARIKVMDVDLERAADALERSARFVQETFIR